MSEGDHCDQGVQSVAGQALGALVWVRAGGARRSSGLALAPRRGPHVEGCKGVWPWSADAERLRGTAFL